MAAGAVAPHPSQHTSNSNRSTLPEGAPRSISSSSSNSIIRSNRCCRRPLGLSQQCLSNCRRTLRCRRPHHRRSLRRRSHTNRSRSRGRSNITISISNSRPLSTRISSLSLSLNSRASILLQEAAATALAWAGVVTKGVIVGTSPSSQTNNLIVWWRAKRRPARPQRSARSPKKRRPRALGITQPPAPAPSRLRPLHQPPHRSNTSSNSN